MNTIKTYSKLTPVQVESIFVHYPQLAYELVSVASFENNRKDLAELVLNGQVEVAVIEAIELPYPLLDGLEIMAVMNDSDPSETDNENSLNGLLVIVAAKSRNDLKEIFSTQDIRQSYGKVTLVGFGPGSPDLLTIGGEKAIAKANVIFYDDLLDKEFLHKYSAELINVGKRKGKHSAEQANINRLVLNEARKGKNVVRLKGGDPMVLAHGGEEVEYLKTNFVEVSVIPGITTALALASLTQVPLTHRGISSSVAFVSGHAAQIQLPNADTVICYMAGYNIPQIALKAIQHGRDPKTPVLLVSNVSLPEQHEFFYTLETLSTETRTFPTPIISIIGEVVGLRYKSEKDLVKPLYLYTGNEYTGPKINGKIINQPLFEVAELEDKTEVIAEINQLNSFDWIIFTSRYAVKYFFDTLKEQGKDTRSLCRLKIASIGASTTKALNARGIFPDLEPTEDSSYGMLESFAKLTGEKGRILIPRSEKALPIIPDGLTAQGWEVKSLIAYRNQMPENLKPLDLTQFAGIIFASPSCVDNFIKLYGELPAGKELITMGRVTESKLNEYK